MDIENDRHTRNRDFNSIIKDEWECLEVLTYRNAVMEHPYENNSKRTQKREIICMSKWANSFEDKSVGNFRLPVFRWFKSPKKLYWVVFYGHTHCIYTYIYRTYKQDKETS